MDSIGATTILTRGGPRNAFSGQAILHDARLMIRADAHDYLVQCWGIGCSRVTRVLVENAFDDRDDLFATPVLRRRMAHTRQCVQARGDSVHNNSLHQTQVGRWLAVATTDPAPIGRR